MTDEPESGMTSMQGDVRCPNDGEMTNERCWKCGWVRDTPQVGLVTWLRARLDEDERWARAASQTYPHADEGATPPAEGVHWRWVAGENWETVTPDPAVMEFVEGPDGAWSVKLATVEEWPSTSAGRTWMMPRTYSAEIVEMDPSAAGHIIRHDPARVLAEVDAKRRLLDLHQPVLLRKGGGADYYVIAKVCMTCGGSDAAFEDGTPAMRAAAYPCSTLRLLALPYADRPGYRDEWRPV